MQDFGEYANYPEYVKWMKQNDPFEGFFSDAHLPMRIVHDGAEPGHGPIEASLEFVERARAAKSPVELSIRSQSEGQHFAALDEMVGWLAAQRRAGATSRRNEKYFTSGDFVRSVSEAFADRFVLVTGSQATGTELAGQRAIEEEFKKARRTTHNGDCRVVSDTALSPQDERESNLVLIGNNHTNLVWKRPADRMAVDLASDHISINGREWRGRGLSLQAVVPHPQHAGIKVVLIGAGELDNARFGTQDLSIDGWFEFAIWQAVGTSSRLLAADGYERKAPTESRVNSVAGVQ